MRNFILKKSVYYLEELGALDLGIHHKQNSRNYKKFYALFLILVFVLQVSFVSTAESKKPVEFQDSNLSTNDVIVENDNYSIQFDQLSVWDESLGSDPVGFEIYENYLFAQDRYAGFRIYDITDESNPEHLTDYEYPLKGSCSGGPTYDFVLADDKMFLSDFCSDLWVIDFSDIYNPVVLYTWTNITWLHFFVYDNYVFAECWYYGQYQIIVLDPATTEPSVVTSITLPDHLRPIRTDYRDHLLYVHNTYELNLNIYDFSIIDQPQLVTQFIGLEEQRTADIAIHDDYLIAYCNAYQNNSALIVYNITDPLNPTFSNNITSDEVIGLANSTREILIQDDICFVIANDYGLQIIDLTNMSDVYIIDNIRFIDIITISSYLSSVYVLSLRGEIWAFDVSDPQNVSRIHVFNLGDRAGNPIIDNGYLYTTNDYDGFYIFELQTDYNLVPIYHYKDIEFYFEEIAINDNLLFFLADTSPLGSNSSSQLMIFDITIKNNPISLANYTVDFYGIWFNYLIVKENLVFIETGLDDSCEIINVTNPSSPEHLSFYKSPNYNSSHTYDIAVDPDRDLVYFSTSTQLEIVDISDPLNPTLQTAFGQTTAAWLKLVYDNNTLYAGQVSSGLSIFDVSNPFAPLLLASESFGLLYWLNFYNDYLFVTTFLDAYTHIYHWQPLTSGLTRVGMFNQTPFVSCSFEDDIVALARGSLGIVIYRLVITCCPTTSVKLRLNFGVIIILSIITLYFLSSPILKRIMKHKRRKH